MENINILGVPLVELIGYAASLLIAVSLLMSSVKKLRIINLIGALIFAVYGIIINAYPVFIMNLIIIAINIFHLVRIYTSEDYFSVIDVSGNNAFIGHFLSIHEKLIAKEYPPFSYDEKSNTYAFAIMRGLNTAGLLLAQKHDEQSLEILIDFVAKEYRDFKPGRVLYGRESHVFTDKGYTRLLTRAYTREHAAYLLRMGFRKERAKDGSLTYEKKIETA